MIKRTLKRIISIVKLKISNSTYSDILPHIEYYAELNNNNKIIFKGYSFIDKYSLIKNKNGNIILEDKTFIKRYTKIQNLNGNIHIGSNTTINEFSIIQSNEGSIKIGHNVRIAPFVKIFAENHIFSDNSKAICEQGLSSKGIIIGNNVWIGTGSIILDGVTIGDNVVVGAGSVVTKSIEHNKLVAGNPAKIIKEL